MHKWTYAEDAKEEKSVRIIIKKTIHRIVFKWDGEIIGYKERYEYIYEPTFVYSTDEVNYDEVEHETKTKYLQ